jgi:hypothetical protein
MDTRAGSTFAGVLSERRLDFREFVLRQISNPQTKFAAFSSPEEVASASREIPVREKFRSLGRIGRRYQHRLAVFHEEDFGSAGNGSPASPFLTRLAMKSVNETISS